MTNKEAKAVLQEQIDRYGQEYDAEGIEALEIAINVLEQQPCEDCISREKVFEQISCWVNSEEYRYTNATYYLTRRIQGISSVTPQPKVGRWIDEGQYAEGHNEHAYRCSECGEHYIGYVGEFKCCPNCGAKMEEEE